MEQSTYRMVNSKTGTQVMMKEMLKIVRQSPHSVLEDLIGISAIFTMVIVGLHLPMTL